MNYTSILYIHFHFTSFMLIDVFSVCYMLAPPLVITCIEIKVRTIKVIVHTELSNNSIAVFWPRSSPVAGGEQRVFGLEGDVKGER